MTSNLGLEGPQTGAGGGMGGQRWGDKGVLLSVDLTSQSPCCSLSLQVGMTRGHQDSQGRGQMLREHVRAGVN